ncbi:MAG: sulfite exporter TauE/SafE family protein, partial [Proteobacteria bacterium]|nr:sulfite exporter TauE/SafE family protein [Pseudomonadota bacterium]
AYAHRQKNAINYKFFKPIALGIVIGAFLGALFAVQLNGNILKIIIGIFALFVAIQMGINREIKFKERAKQNKETYFVGTGIGFTSSILGIGGGIFSVPYLKASGLTMTSSIGTSAACGIPIAIFGALGYIISGINNELLPPLTLGYIYLPALLGISLTSIIAAKYGAHIAHHVSEKILKRMMASMMLLISFYMVFS